MTDFGTGGALKGFKEFVLRGNVIDLAIAVVIGAAFTAIVNAIVTGIFNPAIGALFNAATLNDALDLRIPTTGGGVSVIKFGVAVAALLQFVIVAAVVYFALVLPINHLKKVAFARQQEEAAATPAHLPPTEAELLGEIRDLLAAQADAGTLPTTTGKHAVITAPAGKPAS
ncbi:MAG: mechanosensitive ion channel protein MscL [Naasia sp.]|uniref:large conductance mechanosensitive channel protein MscL n=1 Tax=Naasia sp. TaxID=2546198 RepID=UPI00262647C8|nr:large conductance mechanosensitive channel protein MscL [Naasia sp.]MCU1569510.1 mechanosensitive ion channel protein MscL [Naasia sp.]